MKIVNWFKNLFDRGTTVEKINFSTVLTPDAIKEKLLSSEAAKAVLADELKTEANNQIDAAIAATFPGLTPGQSE